MKRYTDDEKRKILAELTADPKHDIKALAQKWHVTPASIHRWKAMLWIESKEMEREPRISPTDVVNRVLGVDENGKGEDAHASPDLDSTAVNSIVSALIAVLDSMTTRVCHLAAVRYDVEWTDGLEEKCRLTQSEKDAMSACAAGFGPLLTSLAAQSHYVLLGAFALVYASAVAGKISTIKKMGRDVKDSVGASPKASE